MINRRLKGLISPAPSAHVIQKSLIILGLIVQLPFRDSGLIIPQHRTLETQI